MGVVRVFYDDFGRPKNTIFDRIGALYFHQAIKLRPLKGKFERSIGELNIGICRKCHTNIISTACLDGYG